jgi:hypothetical protein
MRHLNDFQSHIQETKKYLRKSSLNEEDLMRLEDILQFVIDDWGIRPKTHENVLEKMTYEFILRNDSEIILRVDIFDPEIGSSEYLEKKQRFNDDMFTNFSKRAWRHGYSVESLGDFLVYNPSTWTPVEMLKWVITKI